MTEANDSKAEAERRLRTALDLIARSRTILCMACTELSCVGWPAYHFDHVSKAADDLKALWHLVNTETAGRKLEMDSDWKPGPAGAADPEF